jgi:flagellar motor switch/type III secretory pathway protein FliN
MGEDNKPLLSAEELADLLAPLDNGEEGFELTLRAGSTTLAGRDLENLGPGSELEFAPPRPGPLELHLNGRCIGHARPVPGSDRPRVRIIDIDLPPDLRHSRE